MNLNKIKTSKRIAESKSETNKIRREGNIPAVLYVRGKSSEPIQINGTEFKAILRGIEPGRLSTTIFTLVDEKGNVRKAIIKDIQYVITTYDVNHLDFEELIEDQPVNIKVPIECYNIADCTGIKLGGVLRNVIRQLRVRCLPKDIPNHFPLDVKDLGMGQSKKLSNIEIPNTIRPLENLNQVAVVIVKR